MHARILRTAAEGHLIVASWALAAERPNLADRFVIEAAGLIRLTVALEPELPPHLVALLADSQTR
jgi:hypothetical protein